VIWGLSAPNRCDFFQRLIGLDLEEPLGWLHRSYALHELKQTTEARDNLLRVVDQFPMSATIWPTSIPGRRLYER
jgi:hypothetical protein